MKIGDRVIARFDLENFFVVPNVFVKRGSRGVVVKMGTRKVRKNTFQLAIVDFDGKTLDTHVNFLKITKK